VGRLVAVFALVLLSRVAWLLRGEGSVTFVLVGEGGISVATIGEGAPTNGAELADRIARIVRRWGEGW